jgi:hypothetical protein
MKKILLSIITVLILCSCSGANQQQSSNEFKPSKTSIETLKELLRMICKNNIDAESAFLRKNETEILKTLEVLEEFECESEVFIVFYRYSIGTTTVKNTRYFRKVDNFYYPFFKIYSTYDNDPFKNGKGEAAKKILKKAEDWKSDESIWWRNDF